MGVVGRGLNISIALKWHKTPPTLLPPARNCSLDASWKNFRRRNPQRMWSFSTVETPKVSIVGLLMAEILHQLRLVVYLIIYRVSYIQGGAGFQPSTGFKKKNDQAELFSDVSRFLFEPSDQNFSAPMKISTWMVMPLIFGSG